MKVGLVQDLLQFREWNKQRCTKELRFEAEVKPTAELKPKDERKNRIILRVKENKKNMTIDLFISCDRHD